MDKNIDIKIQQGIENYMNSKQFSVSKIPNHVHNGTDTNQIQESSLIPAPTFSSFLIENVTETIILTNIPPTLTSVKFQGIAANNAADLSLPGTKKAVCNGEAIFRNCFAFTGSGTSVSVGGGQTLSLIQSATSMYIDEASLANATVGVSGLNILYVIDETQTEIASLAITSFDKGILTIDAVVASGWAIQGTLILT
jgi:hypothetical protein